jgi:hypothetical protein
MVFVFSLTVPSLYGYSPYPVGLMNQYLKNIKPLIRTRAQKRMGIPGGNISACHTFSEKKSAIYSILPIIHAWFIWFVT